MEFWVFLALALGALALRLVMKLSGEVRRLRGDVVTLEGRLSALTRAAAEAKAAASEVTPAASPAPAIAQTLATDEPAAVPLVTFEEVGATAIPSIPAMESQAEGPAPGPAPELTQAIPDVGAPPPPALGATDEVESLERQIGSKWLLYLGVVAIVLGVSYFIKYAFDNEWVAPPLRVGLGIAGGAALVWLGQMFVGRGLERYGQTLTGGGIGILYLAIYAAHHWYGLIARGPAFAAMVIITLAGVTFADRQRSQILALFAVTIGFLTPWLVGGEAASPVTLFTYDLVLVCGTLLLARRRDWPALNIVSFMLTTMTISSWAEQNYRRSDYLTMELFLTAFLALFLLVLRENRKSQRAIAPLGTLLLGISPLLYHLASLSVLGPHRGPLLIYLIGFSLAGVIVATWLRAAWLRAGVWLFVAIPFLGFASTRLPRGWVVAAWVTLGAIYGVHLIAQIQALDEERDHLPAPELLLLHANALWALTAVWLLLAPRSIEGLAPAAFAMAIAYGGLAFAARRWHREASLHGAALAMTLAAAACAMRFERPWMSVAFGMEGAALVWLGLRERRAWVRHGGSLFLSLAAAFLLILLATPLGVDEWPFFNTRALAAVALVAMMYAAAWWTRTLADPHESLGFGVARLVVVANILTVLAITAEISAYFGLSGLAGQGEPGGSGWTSAELSRQLTLSITWAAYAVGLVAIGLRIDYRPIRLLAIALFAITIGKVFFIDLAELDRVSRMLSLIGLGVLLLVAAWLYQRLRGEPPSPQPSSAEGAES